MSFDVNLKRTISLSSILFVNVLFLTKYLGRVSSYYLLISLVLTVFYGLLASNTLKLGLSEKQYKYLKFITTLVYTILLSLIFLRINVESLNVDRWSVISSFWEAVFNGKYPYLAESHMGNKPGPMPFYYLIALPFYLLGELGYFSLLGIIIFLTLQYRIKTDANYKFLMHFFVLTSAFYLWEVVVRSNIFTTSILVVWFLFSFIKQEKTENKIYLYAILAGLLLSTRAVFSIPYIIFFIYFLRKKEMTFYQMSKFVFVAFITFLMTFLPLLITYYDDFFEMNPFIIQSTFLVPFYITMSFILLAFIFSFLTKTKDDLFFWSGLALFITVSVFITYNLIEFGIDEFLIGARADISYYIFCIPFFIVYLLNTYSIKHKKNLEV